MSQTSIGGGFRLDTTGGKHISRLVETLRVDFLLKAQKIFQLNLVIIKVEDMQLPPDLSFYKSSENR